MDTENSNEQSPIEISEEERKELIWEENNEKITTAIHYLLRKEIKATVSNIARTAELSRKTVYEHLHKAEFKPVQKVSGHVNRFMIEEVVTRLCRKAIFGDLKAARLYLELMGAIQAKGTVTNTNLVNGINAIQVNGLMFTEDMVESLSAENLAQLEEFVKSASGVTGAKPLKMIAKEGSK